MIPLDLYNLARAWISASPEERGPRVQGLGERTFTIAREGSPRGWALVRALVREAHDDASLEAVATGPLQDFVTASGDSFAEEMAVEAFDHERFETALRGITYPGTSARVQSLIGRLRADHAFRNEPHWRASPLWENVNSEAEKNVAVDEELRQRGAFQLRLPTRNRNGHSDD